MAGLFDFLKSLPNQGIFNPQAGASVVPEELFPAGAAPLGDEDLIGSVINPDVAGTLEGGSIFKDPNFLKLLGGMGAKLGAGQSVGEALDPSQVVGDISAQKAGSQILSGILPTPVGQKGPDAVTTKQTADGTTTTITEPSEANLGSFGSTTPAESIKATPPAGGQDFSPFFRGLLE